MSIKNEKREPNGAETRRTFLRKGLMATSLLPFIPRVIRAQGDVCGPTSTDYYGLGPFYATGAPTRHMLASPEEPGDRIFLTGTVFANDCITPLNNVILDVWHADTTGCYSRFGECENPTQDDYKLRGIIRTGTDGNFAIETIMPGRYLNGSQFRPSHIHFKVRPPEGVELITQLYFEGDPFIPVDAAASRPDAAGRIIPLEQKSDGQHGIFDIVLNVPPTAGVSSYDGSATNTRLRQNHPNPVSGSTRFPFQLARRMRVRLTVHDVRGKLITTLLSDVMDAGLHSVEWNVTDESGLRLPAGAYVYRLRTDDCDSSRIMTVL